jgi:hypothetical protein
MLLLLKHVMDGFNVANIITMIMQTFHKNGNICNFDAISHKKMSFGVDRLVHFKVTTWLLLPKLILICSIHDWISLQGTSNKSSCPTPFYFAHGQLSWRNHGFIS